MKKTRDKETLGLKLSAPSSYPHITLVNKYFSFIEQASDTQNVP